MTEGISLGCPLSPLIGAFFLSDLDARMEQTGLFYVRFMDDILVLAPTHARPRTAVRAVNETLSTLRPEKHPDKTFIGKIHRGFDFLGYRFGAPALKLAQATIEKFVEPATQLYEQGRRAAQQGFRCSGICPTVAGVCSRGIGRRSKKGQVLRPYSIGQREYAFRGR